jgi:hypothetical protein
MAAPLGKQAARAVEIAVLQRLVDVGEVMAVLAEAHREVEHQHVARQAEERVRGGERGVDRPREHHRGHDREEPGDRPLVRLPGVEVALQDPSIARHRREERAPIDERAPLLERERDQEGKKAHADKRGTGSERGL